MESEILEELERRLAAEETVVIATALAGNSIGRQALLDAEGTILKGNLDADSGSLRRSAIEFIGRLGSGSAAVEINSEPIELFFDVFPPPPQIYIIGAVHVAIHLISLARELGFRSIVIDPRTAFATKDRFAKADELLTEWPADALANRKITSNTYFALLSHDLKIDLPALEVALRSPARYIGALGSKKTHAKRVAALEELGFSADEIARIRNPIGLDLGGRKAEEIALAVLAEMVAVRHAKAG